MDDDGVGKVSAPVISADPQRGQAAVDPENLPRNPGMLGIEQPFDRRRDVGRTPDPPERVRLLRGLAGLRGGDDSGAERRLDQTRRNAALPRLTGDVTRLQWG